MVTAKPQLQLHSVAWHLLDSTVFSRVARALNPLRIGRQLAGRPLAACDLTSTGVPDTSFFTNRDIAAMSDEEIHRGPTKAGQEAKAPFTITKMKGEGKTAGFFVTDAKGDRYLFKLDAPDYPELVTSAEVVTSKLLYALGYFVPSYEIVAFAPSQLAIDPKLSLREHELQDELGQLLAAHQRQGLIRVSASRMIDGDIIGHIAFKRYSRCAELRGLRLAYAWLNDTDAKDHNSLMVWQRGWGRGYLIDFGTSLGGEPVHGTKAPCQGWQYDVDLGDLAKKLFTFGLYSSGCDVREQPASPAVGRFSPRFDPRRWKPYVPNLAFDEMTPAEGRWMTERIMRFSAEQLAAAVSAGRYSHSDDELRLLELLEVRRQAIAEAYAPDLASRSSVDERLASIRTARKAAQRRPPDWLVP
ncbi:MAG: hypothetical protein HYZ91_04835 [Candidatus Omnitrophica bacterium]|nr:hypothetical protein [Candidatus Omnitrophota bacterium]